MQLPCVILRLHSAQGLNTVKEKLNSFFALRVYDVAFDCRVLQFYSVPSAHDTF